MLPFFVKLNSILETFVDKSRPGKYYRNVYRSDYHDDVDILTCEDIHVNDKFTACSVDVIFFVPCESIILSHYNKQRILRHQNCCRDLKIFFVEMHCIFVRLLCFVLFYFTLRFVFAKYWLVLILTRAISTTGHPALSRSHHVRSHTVNFLTPKIILVIDKSDSRFAVVRFCEITD